MRKMVFAVVFFFVIYKHAEGYIRFKPIEPLSTAEEENMKTIKETCLTYKDYMELIGNVVPVFHAPRVGRPLLNQCITTLGLNELRKTLGFPPLGAWKPYNGTWPSESELAAATTIEEYYNLIEPKDEDRSLDSELVFEKDMTRGMTFIEKHYPLMQKMFKSRYEAVLKKNEGVAGRNEVDEMILEFLRFQDRFTMAILENRILNKC